jgi:deoxyribose-phosphate aldolase
LAELDELAAMIAEKALARLRAGTSGGTWTEPQPARKEAPAWPATGGAGRAPSAAEAPRGRPPADDVPKECNPNGCAPCDDRPMCGAREMFDVGTARLTPLAIRTSRDIAGYIDHTLLKPDATRDDIIKVCDEARKWGFATVCLNSSNIALASRLLSGSQVKPIAVVGFPLGAATTSAKVFETREAVRNGAGEIDMVINIGALKSHDYALVECDIRSVVDAARPRPVKVILETGGLTRDEKVIGCALSKAAGAAFVKTSTGFGTGGATAEDIALMRSIVGDDVGVKASGGVRTTQDAQKMIEAGANRIGASASIAIVTNASAAGPAKAAGGGKY